uniref:guanylate cyclase n=1 Tax=Macrostomum lignano TaxID=282301 RepID=A0A1I8FK74_9PLAT
LKSLRWASNLSGYAASSARLVSHAARMLVLPDDAAGVSATAAGVSVAALCTPLSLGAAPSSRRRMDGVAESAGLHQLISVPEVLASLRVNCVVAAAAPVTTPQPSVACSPALAAGAVVARRRDVITRLETRALVCVLQLPLCRRWTSQRRCQEVQAAAKPTADEQLTRGQQRADAAWGVCGSWQQSLKLDARILLIRMRLMYSWITVDAVTPAVGTTTCAHRTQSWSTDSSTAAGRSRSQVVCWALRSASSEAPDRLGQPVATEQGRVAVLDDQQGQLQLLTILLNGDHAWPRGRNCSSVKVRRTATDGDMESRGRSMMNCRNSGIRVTAEPVSMTNRHGWPLTCSCTVGPAVATSRLDGKNRQLRGGFRWWSYTAGDCEHRRSLHRCHCRCCAAAADSASAVVATALALLRTFERWLGSLALIQLVKVMVEPFQPDLNNLSSRESVKSASNSAFSPESTCIKSINMSRNSEMGAIMDTQWKCSKEIVGQETTRRVFQELSEHAENYAPRWDNKYAIGVPEGFFGANHCNTKWLLNVMGDTSDFRLMRMLKQGRTRMFDETDQYYQLLESSRPSSAILNPFGIAIYLRYYNALKIIAKQQKREAYGAIRHLLAIKWCPATLPKLVYEPLFQLQSALHRSFVAQDPLLFQNLAIVNMQVPEDLEADQDSEKAKKVVLREQIEFIEPLPQLQLLRHVLRPDLLSQLCARLQSTSVMRVMKKRRWCSPKVYSIPQISDMFSPDFGAGATPLTRIDRPRWTKLREFLDAAEAPDVMRIMTGEGGEGMSWHLGDGQRRVHHHEIDFRYSCVSSARTFRYAVSGGRSSFLDETKDAQSEREGEPGCAISAAMTLALLQCTACCLKALRNFVKENYGEDMWHFPGGKCNLRAKQSFLGWLTPLVKISTIDAETLIYANGATSSSYLSQVRLITMAIHDAGSSGATLRATFSTDLTTARVPADMSYKKLKPPSFFCMNESSTGITLQYRTRRQGYTPYKLQDDFPVRSEVFFEVFPFNIVFNRGLVISEVGDGMLNALPDIVGKDGQRSVSAQRPMIIHLGCCDATLTKRVRNYGNSKMDQKDSRRFRLLMKRRRKRKGQQRRHKPGELQKKPELHLGRSAPPRPDEVHGRLGRDRLLGTPQLQDVDTMQKAGLFVKRLEHARLVRDMVLAVRQQQAEELKLALQQQEEKSKRFSRGFEKNLNEERKRSDELLYQMIPKQVADKIRTDGSSANTCSTFEERHSSI